MRIAENDPAHPHMPRLRPDAPLKGPVVSHSRAYFLAFNEGQVPFVTGASIFVRVVGDAKKEAASKGKYEEAA